MEITDQDISDFIKSRGKFTYMKAEASPYFYSNPYSNNGDVWEYRLEIFGIDVWYQTQSHFHDQSILDEIKDSLIKRLISGGYAGASFDAGVREKILKILRREKNLNYLINEKG